MIDTTTQTLTGIRFAFPRLSLALEKGGKYKSLFAFEKKISAEAHIAKYLKSERRQEFSSGLFRKYDELDGEA